MVISEIMYNPGAWANGQNIAFVELFNSAPYPTDIGGYHLRGSIDYTFPAGTVLEARSFLVVAADPQAVEDRYDLTGVHGPYSGSLDRDEGEIRLVHPNGGVLLEAEYRATFPWPAAAAGAGHSLVLARPSYGQDERAAWEPSVWKGGSPGLHEPELPNDPLNAIKINEFLAHTDEPDLDFIELYNHSNETVDLSGVWLSDKPYENRFQIPDGTTIGPRGFLVYDELELPFSLAAAGEGIYVVTPDDTRVIDAIAFEAQLNGISMGRYPDGAPEFALLAAQTPGAPNSGTELYASPVIINEIMFNPISNDDDDTYIELYNRSDMPVDVSDWRFVDGISFVIPPGTVIPADAYLVVAKDAERLIDRYPQLNPGNTVGDFGGRLANSGERLALAMPSLRSELPTDYVVVDELYYRDGGRWGDWANQDGSSLELRDPRADNRRAANWTHSDETDKSEWVLIEHTGVLDHGQNVCQQLHILMPSAGEVLLDQIEVRVNDGPNLVPNSDFQSGFQGWMPSGNHVKSHLHTGEGYGGGQSMRLVALGGGDTGANRVAINLTQSLSAGSTVTLRARARWLAGHRQVLLRLEGNYLEAVGELPIPGNLGTPGLPNTAWVPNAGPALYDVLHHPVMPAANEPVTVTARAHDPDGVASMTLYYRVDPSEHYSAVAMRDDGLDGDAVAEDGLFSAIIPGQSSGTLVAFYIEAIDHHAEPAAATYPDDPAQYEALVRFGESAPQGTLSDYRMWYTQATRSLWLSPPGLSNQRYPGTLVYGNRVIHGIRARHRGSPFRRSSATNFSGISFHTPRDDRLLGAREFNLNKFIGDNTRQREKVGYWFAEQLGLPFSHQAFIRFHINGSTGGDSYTDIHHIDSDYIRTWFPDQDEGELYKIDDWFEFYVDGNGEFQRRFNVNAQLGVYTTTGGVKKQARYRWNWNKRSNRWLDDDYTSLFALVDAVNTPGTDAYTQAVESIANIEQWMRVFAARRLTSDWDGYGYNRGKNAWTFKPYGDGFHMILWDIDKGLGASNAPSDADLFVANDPVVTRMYQHPPFRRAYLRAFREAVDVALRADLIDPIMDDVYAGLQAENYSASNPDVLKTWIAERRAYVLGVLNNEDAPWEPDQTGAMTTGEQVITLTGTAPFSVKSIAINGHPYPVTWTDKNTWQLTVALEQAESPFQIQGLDRSGDVLETSLLTVTYTGTLANPVGALVINEIMPHPAVPGTEFVEIHNTSDTHTFDLTGYRLRGVDFDFAPGTLIDPGGFLLVVRNQAAFETEYGFGHPVAGEYSGTLQPAGERLRLVRLATESEPELLIDEVNYRTSFPWPEGAVGTGASLQRIDPTQASDHPGNWRVASADDPAPEPSWQFVSLTAQTHPSNPSDRVYIYMESPGEVHIDDLFLSKGGTAEAGDNVIQNGSFNSLEHWTISPNHAGSSLDTEIKRSGNSSLHVVASSGGSTQASAIWQDGLDLELDAEYTLSFWYLPNPNGSTLTVRLRFSGFIPNGLITSHNVLWDDAVASPLATPGAPNSGQTVLPPFPALWINEVQPRNDGTFTNQHGVASPWTELYYDGAEPLSLEGYFLTNDPDQPQSWAFPIDAVLQPGEHVLVWLDGQPEQTTADEWHAAFTIDPESGALYLFRAVDQIDHLVDWLDYAAVPWGRSYGRFPDGDPEATQVFLAPTPGQPNDGLSIPLIHFWYIDDEVPNNTPLEELAATYSLVDAAHIEYQSALLGYPFDASHPDWRKASMERRNRPTELNYRSRANQNLPYDAAAMRGLQIRQPFSGDGGENTLVFHLPTTGYEEVVFSFAARDEGAAEGLVVDYSTASGTPSWLNTGLSTYTFDLADAYQLYTIDFSAVDEVDDNPHFKVRIRFDVADGAADDGNRVTFNNFALEGLPLAGINLPPQLIEEMAFTKAIEGQPFEVDLSAHFEDPDGDELTFVVEPHVVSPEIIDWVVTGSTLTVSPQYRGETTVTVSADDGHHPPVTTSFRTLVYPQAHPVAESDFTFDYWDADSPEKTYPEHMLFLQSNQSDTALDTPLEYAYHLEPGDYHDDDAGTLGFPYNNTGRTRINGLGDEGIAFINTGQDRDLGGALLALDTRQVNEAEVEWLAGTLLPNIRVYAIRLQYRIGTSGDFIDLTDENEEPIEYVRSEVEGDVEPMPPVQLPVELLGQEYVQLLWRYYRLSDLDDAGPRGQLRLDNISVNNTVAPDGFNGWRFQEFSPEERMDVSVSGPLADPDDSGIPNLLRYALGLGRGDPHLAALPRAEEINGGPVFSHRRLLDPHAGIEYGVHWTEDLVSPVYVNGAWPTATPGVDILPLEPIPTGDGLTEWMRYQILPDSLQPMRLLKLRVTQD